MLEAFVKSLSPLGVIVLGFCAFGDTMSPQAKQAVANWLRLRNTGSRIRVYGHTFSDAFVRIFGQRHFSLRCFVLASGISIGSVLALSGGLHYWSNEYYISVGDAIKVEYSRYLQFGVAVLATNAVVDWVSLMQTRNFVAWSRLSKPARRVPILALDLVVTAYIFVVGCVISVSIGALILNPDDNDHVVGLFLLIGSSLTFTVFATRIRTDGEAAVWPLSSRLCALVSVVVGGIFAVFLGALLGDPSFLEVMELSVPYLDAMLVTTFLTSFWLWAVILGEVIIRGASRVQWIADKVLWVLPIEKRPFFSIGVMSFILLFCIEQLARHVLDLPPLFG